MINLNLQVLGSWKICIHQCEPNIFPICKEFRVTLDYIISYLEVTLIKKQIVTLYEI